MGREEVLQGRRGGYGKRGGRGGERNNSNAVWVWVEEKHTS